MPRECPRVMESVFIVKANILLKIALHCLRKEKMDSVAAPGGQAQERKRASREIHGIFRFSYAPGGWEERSRFRLGRAPWRWEKSLVSGSADKDAKSQNGVGKNTSKGTESAEVDGSAMVGGVAVIVRLMAGATKLHIGRAEEQRLG